MFAALAASVVAASVFALDEARFRLDSFDFDQRRSGLGGGGNMFCVPTSFANICAYLHKYGNPQMLLGYNPASHSSMTTFIEYLGFLLGTDPDDGTSGSASKEFAYVDARTSKLIFFGDYGPWSNWGYKTMMNTYRSGALIQFARGRYKPFGDMWDRDGGHALTLMGYDRLDSQFAQDKFYAADPAQDDGDNTVQSPFFYKVVPTANITLHILGQPTPVTHARHTFNTGVGGNRRYLIDRMMIFSPMYAGWNGPTGDRETITIKIPYMAGPVGALPPQTYSVGIDDAIRDWCFDPSGFGLVTLSDKGDVHRIDVIDESSVPLLSGSAGRQVVVGGPDQAIYVLLEGLAFDSIARVPREGGRYEVRDLPGKAAAIDVDARSGGVVALDSSLTSATEFDADFTHSWRTDLKEGLPHSVPRRASTGEGLFQVDSMTGDWFVAEVGTRSWIRYVRRPLVRFGIRVEAKLGRTIQGMVPGSQRTVFLQDDAERLYTFDWNGNPKLTEFTGMQSRGKFSIPRSFSFGKPELSVGDKWRNVNSTEEEP